MNSQTCLPRRKHIRKRTGDTHQSCQAPRHSLRILSKLPYNPPNQNNTSSFEIAIHEEDGDGMRGYCRIFTKMGECDLSLILSHEEMNQHALVELILWCSAIRDKGEHGTTFCFCIFISL